MRIRVISAAVVAPIILGLLLWPGGDTPFPGWPFALLILILTLMGLREFYDSCRTAGLLPLDGFGYAAGVLMIALATPHVHDPNAIVSRFGITLLIMASLAAEALRRRHSPLRNLGALWLGTLLVAWLFPFILRLRLASGLAVQHLDWTLPSHWMVVVGEGAWLVLFTLVVTSCVDTGAYFTGKALGKHKLAPEVSPNKTWEGSIGGFFAALAVGALIGWWLRLPLAFSVTASALIGVLGQLGDLSLSAVKRELGVKDFSSLIPGHGGVLDRFDSLLFTAPAVYWLMVLWRQ